jgi:hypothetical protein
MIRVGALVGLALTLGLGSCEDAVHAPPPATGGSLAEDWAALSSTLGSRLDDEASARADRTALEAFLARHAATVDAASSLPIARARSMLGDVQLRLGDASAARQTFRRLANSARLLPEADRVDVLARARYGLARATELAGDEAGAIAAYSDLLEDRELAGTRYQRLAAIARNRLRASDVDAPRLAVVTDLSGKSHRLDTFGADRRALLLAFVEPGDDAGRALVLGAVRAADAGDARTVVLVLGRDDELLRDAAREFAEADGVIPCPEGYAAEAATAYGVAATPTWFLLSPEGLQLARDPSPARLGELLDMLADEPAPSGNGR